MTETYRGHCPTCHKKQTNTSKELVDVVCWDCERAHDAKKFKESAAYLLDAKITCVDGYISSGCVIESIEIETADGKRFIMSAIDKYGDEDGEICVDAIKER